LEYANAGHCQPVWVDGKSGEVRRLDADGMLLGIWPEVTFEKRTIELKEGDVVFIFTDGASEARSPSGEQFSEERLAEIVAAHRHLSAGEILNVVQEELMAFTESESFSDDVTMVVLRRVGDNER
ncbi:MAG TPA: serine/threonine-protein phosphatase, partial [Bacteroidetes bacterium]|nr:serine/threonine-protein phosphatase [Bacteroidota bacterium]